MYKIPISCLVFVHSGERVLLLERTDRQGFWQSVTGSWEEGESLLGLAQRELFEETGFHPSQGVMRDRYWANQYEIYMIWRHRYAPGVCYNTEHIFTFELPMCLEPVLAAREHTHFEWVHWQEAAQRVFSESNRKVIRWFYASLAGRS